MSEQFQAAAEVWRIASERLRRKVSENTYLQWFANLVPVRLEAELLTIGVADEFFGDWLKNSYSDMIVAALSDVSGVSYRFELEAGHVPAAPAPAARPAVAVLTPAAAPAAMPTAAESGNATAGRGRLTGRYTFDNFIVGEENRYAFTAAKRAADCPGEFNPLYIYGNTGIGKTHLLHAIAQQTRTQNPTAVVRYATCEEILNSFVDSLRRKSYSDFRSWLREVDMLLVDDIHILGKKEELQEQFRNAFNALYSEGKQIVLTSDKRPAEIIGLEARLISRFEQGLTTELYAPGFEIRLAILRSMQETHLVRFDETVLEFIASRISSNVRRLKGALLRLVAMTAAQPERKINVEFADELLHKLFEEERAIRQITVEDVQGKVAEYFNLRKSELLSDKRPKNIAQPRMVAMFLARKLTSQSFPQIGEAFGRNHATIISACNKVPELCERDEELRRAVALLERQLEATR